jgi:nicotinate-nucleotide adenylyltransferase
MKKRMRIGLFGGSFDPVHHGHLIAASTALEAFELDRIVLIPCHIQPHKHAGPLTPGADRMAMLQQAVEANDALSVSDIELQRGGISYTIDTLDALQQQFPEAELYFIIGEDSLTDLHRWHRIEELLERCRFITLARPGSNARNQPPEALNLPSHHAERILASIADSRLIDISSSDIRTRIASGRSIRYLVPLQVEAYILLHRLYAQKEST